MRKEELDRRCAEMKARMLAQRAIPPEVSRLSSLVQTVRTTDRQPELVVDVDPEAFRIERPLPLVMSTRRVLRQRGTTSPLIHLGGTESLDIAVGRASVSRALWFMQQLITKCEGAGIKFSVSPKHPATTSAVVDGRSIQIRVKEKTTRIEKPPSAEELARRKIHDSAYWSREYEYLPSGTLYFEILEWHAPRKKWTIPTCPSVEECLESVVTNLQQTSRALRKAEEDRLEQQARWIEEERRRLEAQQRRAEESKRIEELRREAADWSESTRICSYLDAFEEHLSGLECDLSENGDVGRWLAWARKYAFNLNPLNRTTKNAAGEVVVSDL